MTRNRPIDRVLDHWFVDGPDEMPDRVLLAVFDQVDRTPQRRLARLTARYDTMPGFGRMALIAAAIVLAVGLGLTAQNLLQRGPDVGVPASPDPTPSTTPAPPSAGIAGLPAALRHAFLGPLRDIPELGDGIVSAFEMRTGSFAWETGVTGSPGATLMRASAGINADGQLELLSSGDPACDAGAVGRYRFAVSAGGNFLTIEPGTDACDVRAAALPGEWLRSDCRDRSLLCLGPLEPGRYSSLFFDPRVPEGGESTPQFGGLAYEVPAGWANAKDFGGDYALVTQAAYEAGTPVDGAQAADHVALYAEPAAATRDCKDTSEPGIGTRPEDLAQWLLDHEGLLATEQASIDVDGRPARVVDVEVEPSWTGTCGPEVAVPLFVGPGGWHAAIFAGDRMRLVAVDLGGGDALLVIVDTFDPATLGALVAQAMPVIETFEFADEE